jgi:imidazolonepropionase
MADGETEGIRNGAVLIEDGIITYAGPEDGLDREMTRGLPMLDAEGGLVSPGLVDCHSHLVFMGSRSDEFLARSAGLSYEEISRRGGGLMRTVRATREASRDELHDAALARVWRFLAQGVTTVEAKSGYGLDLPSELRILEVIRDLDLETPADIVSTFLGAHAIPPEVRSRREAHVDAIVNEWIPAVAEAGLARFCDVFCESVAFSVPEASRILSAGLDHGLKPKIHADQLSRTGGTRLAAEIGAVSVDHADFADADDIARLAGTGTVAVLLPGCPVSLAQPRFPPGRPLLDAGLRVALSTDFNPGSSVTMNLTLMGTFALAYMGLTLRETWAALTTHAAAALGLDHHVGRLVPGFQGDLAIFHDPDPCGPFYEYGGSSLARVVKRGRVVVQRSTSGEVGLAM